MTKERVSEINALWFDSDVYKWLNAKSRGDDEEADKINGTLFERGYLGGVEWMSEEVWSRIHSKVKTADEWDKYLMELENEQPELVDIIIRTGIFDPTFFGNGG